jgi:predicted extracellular nuclease
MVTAPRRGFRSFIALLTVLGVLVALTPAPAMSESVDGCGDSFTPIYAIQGDGQVSPEDGEVVTTEGVVTVDLQMTSEIRGFFIQDPTGDGLASTSDGLFVFHQDTWSPSFDPSVGDHVRVTGTIVEQFGNTQMEFLQTAEVCNTGPNLVPQKTSAREFMENPEQYEGMYLRFKDGLYVTDTFNLHRFGEVWLAQEGVVENPTNQLDPGTDELFAFADDGIARSILLDDGSRFSNPDPVPHLSGDTLRLGDRVKNLTGAINFSFGQYRVQPQGEVDFKAKNKRTHKPMVKGDLVVASFNVLNYWTTLEGRGAVTPEQLAVQQDKLVSAILGMDADVVGLQEVENDPNCGDPATPCSHTPTETLVAALNAEFGADVWTWVGEVNHYNYYPIRNEIIYRNDRVSAVGPPVSLADPAFDTFRNDDPPLENDSQLGRPPVAQTFEADGEVFTVMVNHFKSKGSPCDVLGDADLGDGQGNCSQTRVAQSEAVLEFVDTLVADSGDPDVLVIGDLNSYLFEESITTLETMLDNVLAEYDNDPYSFNFFASFAFPFVGRGTLDHALATDSMADQVKDASIWHINADEPRFLDWFDPSRVAPGPYRSSDHDPVLVGLELGG